jgi:ribose transport system substrate-binding protein
MSRKLGIVLVLAMLLFVSVEVLPVSVGAAALSCPPEVDRLIDARSPELGDKILDYYNSWSVKELKAGKQPGKGFTVAVGIGGLGNDTCLFGFWGTIRRLEEMGCKVIYMSGSAGAASVENATIFENFVARKPDAIMYVFCNSQVLGPGLQKAAQRKIPVFGLDNWLSGPSVVGEVTSDNFDIGRKAASYVITRLGGEGNVVELFTPGHRGIEIRNKMWDLMISEYPGIREVSRQPWTDPNTIGSTRDRMEAVLLANPKKGSIDAVHACFDLPGFGAADAIEAAGRQDEMFVIGIDGDREALRRVAKGGAFQATISQDFMLMSATLAHQIVDHLNGKDIPRFIYCPTTLVTRDNVRQVYREKFGEELDIK